MKSRWEIIALELEMQMRFKLTKIQRKYQRAALLDSIESKTAHCALSNFVVLNSRVRKSKDEAKKSFELVELRGD